MDHKIWWTCKVKWTKYFELLKYTLVGQESVFVVCTCGARAKERKREEVSQLHLLALLALRLTDV